MGHCPEYASTLAGLALMNMNAAWLGKKKLAQIIGGQIQACTLARRHRLTQRARYIFFTTRTLAPNPGV